MAKPIKTKTKKKKSYKNARLVLLFSVTFVAALFIISFLIKNFSPTVDVNIGGEEIAQQEEETEEFPEHSIDDRLKWIQFEDNMNESPVVNEVQGYDDENGEVQAVNKRNEAKKKADAKKSQQKNKTSVTQSTEKLEPVKYHIQPPVPTIEEVQNKTNPVPVKTVTKVYIGFYPTQEQAEEIKSKIAGLGYQPYVKKLGSNYIVQIGSFSDRAKAVNVKLDLSDRGYPARLLTE
ncbi:MAG: hypothetical protein K6C94_00460 [Candidatus Gastranaerophilales bacterium]|nr:hypothetical protein [Candidatus Gastranaerophilales bacterium]